MQDKIKEDREVTFETLADIPVIPNALAQVSCDVVTEYIEGDHTLFIGKVRDIRVQDGEPLLFYAGKYRSLESVPV